MIENMKTKECGKCGVSKTKPMFYEREWNFCRCVCAECRREETREYYKTKQGLISRIHNHQIRKSKIRGHNPPSYTRIELFSYLIEDDCFNQLYDNWVASNYLKNLIPSLDRINDYKGYSFDNIRITTWQENNKKAYRDRKNGVNNKINVAVLKLDSNFNILTEYHSIIDAARKNNKTGGAMHHFASNPKIRNGSVFIIKSLYSDFIKNIK